MAQDVEDFEWLIPRGSSDSLEIDYVNDDETPVDLTGYSVEFFDVDPSLSSALSHEWVDASTGKLRIELKALPALPLRRSHPFRVRLVPADPDEAISFPLIRVIAR